MKLKIINHIIKILEKRQDISDGLLNMPGYVHHIMNRDLTTLDRVRFYKKEQYTIIN